MEVSKLKIAWKYLFGGIGSVVDYLLEVLNNALASISAGNKAKVQAALNIAQKVLSTLAVMKWLCPTKWQTAYAETVEAVNTVIVAIDDFDLTIDELSKVRREFEEAVAAWKADDDATCVDERELAGEN